jgi:hypothetical protein
MSWLSQCSVSGRGIRVGGRTRSSTGKGLVTELVQLDKPLAYVLGQFPRALHLIQIPFTDAQELVEPVFGFGTRDQGWRSDEEFDGQGMERLSSCAS